MWTHLIVDIGEKVDAWPGWAQIQKGELGDDSAIEVEFVAKGNKIKDNRRPSTQSS